MECPICNGSLTMEKVPYKHDDIDLGDFEAEVCSKCNEVYFTEKSSDEIDAIARKLGIWGLERKSKISYSGNSLVVRIPKDIARFMKISKGKEIRIYPEKKNKLAIEVK